MDVVKEYLSITDTFERFDYAFILGDDQCLRIIEHLQANNLDCYTMSLYYRYYSDKPPKERSKPFTGLKLA